MVYITLAAGQRSTDADMRQYQRAAEIAAILVEGTELVETLLLYLNNDPINQEDIIATVRINK